MLYIVLLIAFLFGISVTYAYTNSKRRMKDFAGFSNTAMKKALSGELSGKTIREMQDAIRVSDRAKIKNMEQKPPSLIPLP
jgi:hypothetical protein